MIIHFSYVLISIILLYGSFKNTQVLANGMPEYFSGLVIALKVGKD